MSALALPFFLLASFACDARSQGLPAADSQPPDPFRISVNVELVVLQATVRDRKGRFASDLREQDFEIFEDGVKQTLRLFRHEDTPVTVGLVVDHSGSMKPKLADVIVASRTFVRFSNPEDEVFIVNFNEHATLGLPSATRFTNRADELERAILRDPATGQTALYDAVVKALGLLRFGNREKKALIIISDGGDNRSKLTLAQVLQTAERSDALLYTVGIFDEEDPDRNPGVLRQLAQATGGLAFVPGKSDDLAAVCERIAHDIRHQYTLGYVSTNVSNPGTRRSIRVTAGADGSGRLSVRTRSGYIAAGEARLAKDERDK